MHRELEEFLLVLTFVPALFLHHLTEFRKLVRVHLLRVAGVELHAFLLGELYDLRSELSREAAHLAEDHVPGVLVDRGPARLAVQKVQEVHQRGVLRVLAERSHKWRESETRPDIFNLLEQLDHQGVEADLRTAVSPFGGVDSALEALEVGHHRAHHSARKAAAHEQRAHLGVGRVDPVAEEVVDKLLREAAHLHVCVHIQILHKESVGLQHLPDGDHVRMDLAPGERLDGHVQDIGSGAGHLQHRGRGEARSRVAVVLDKNMRVFLLDVACELAEEGRTADSRHILEADLVGSIFNDLVDDAHVIFNSVDRGVGDGEGNLRDHSAFLGELDGAAQVSVVVQAAEGAGDVGALLFLDLEHQFPDIRRYRVHSESVEASFKHMRLDAGLVERGCPAADGHVGVLAEK